VKQSKSADEQHTKIEMLTVVCLHYIYKILPPSSTKNRLVSRDRDHVQYLKPLREYMNIMEYNRLQCN